MEIGLKGGGGGGRYGTGRKREKEGGPKVKNEKMNKWKLGRSIDVRDPQICMPHPHGCSPAKRNPVFFFFSQKKKKKKEERFEFLKRKKRFPKK